MPKYIAFLRAINVGGHIVKMDHLRRLFEALDLANVETFIASGNVIFDAPGKAAALEQKIEKHLRESLGYEVATFLRTAGELADIARYKSFEESELAQDGNTLYVAFLGTAVTAEARKKLLAYRNEVDDFHAHGREIYWLCRRRFSDSRFSGALLEKTIGSPATLRNSTTVRKLAAKYATADDDA